MRNTKPMPKTKGYWDALRKTLHQELSDVYQAMPRAVIVHRSLHATGGIWAVTHEEQTVCFAIFTDGSIKRGRHDQLVGCFSSNEVVHAHSAPRKK